MVRNPCSSFSRKCLCAGESFFAESVRPLSAHTFERPRAKSELNKSTWFFVACGFSSINSSLGRLAFGAGRCFVVVSLCGGFDSFRRRRLDVLAIHGGQDKCACLSQKHEDMVGPFPSFYPIGISFIFFVLLCHQAQQ